MNEWTIGELIQFGRESCGKQGLILRLDYISVFPPLTLQNLYVFYDIPISHFLIGAIEVLSIPQSTLLK